MKDLDFDELDRAVNSLIENVSDDDDTAPAEKVLDIDSKTVSTTTQPSAPLTSTPAPTERRSTGRFMDFVPSSANTKLSLTTPNRVSRQGVSIDAPKTAQPARVLSDIKPAPASQPAAAPQVSPANDWPDPIDFQNKSNTTNATPPANDEIEDADIDQINNDISKTLGQISGDLPETPFISGTKVDKRPLGAFSTGLTDSAQQPQPEATAAAQNQPVELNRDSQMPDKNNLVNVDTPLPAELRDDLLSIESGAAPEATKPETQPTPTPVAASTPVGAVPATTTPNQPVAGTSIAQQYKEQLSSGDQTTGAIYDTNSYHKALLHPAKKKSGWLLVVWIVAIILVGAGAGAAVYFFVLPNL